MSKLTELQRLNRISIYEELGLSQEEISWRLKKDEEEPIDPFWELIRDKKFTKLEELSPDTAWSDKSFEDLVLDNAKLFESTDNIKPGDILIVNKFNNLGQDKVVNNSTHRLVIVGIDEHSNKNKNKYFGYALSTQCQHSNKFNKYEPKHIFIRDYDTIVENDSKHEHSSVYINLKDIAEIGYNDIVAKVGHITTEFYSFLQDTQKMISQNKDTSEVFWEK